MLDNGRLHIVFADPASGLATINADRVDSIAWIASNGVSTGNLAANGGPLHCNDPQEFFGEAYGENGSGRPFLVIAGETIPWHAKAGQTLTGSTKVNTKKACDLAADAATKTTYTLSTKPALVNQLTIKRTFTFKTVNTAGNIRAYVPRMPEGAYSGVRWPNAAGVVQTGDAGGCGGGCEVTDWNGVWFADQNAAGAGLAVIRNPAKLPAVMLFDNDSFSFSNNSAVALKLPANGWSGTVTETENLCFYDATTWPASAQASGQLPTGCSMP